MITAGQYAIIFSSILFSQNILAQSQKADSLKTVLKTLPEDSVKVLTFIKLCRAQSFIDSKQVLLTANEALALSQKINFQRGEANAYFQLGYSYYKMGNIPKALGSLLNALRIYEKTHNTSEIGFTYNAIGLIYRSQGDAEEALSFFRRAHSTWSKQGLKRGISIALGNMGEVYESEQKDSLALNHYEQSLKLLKEINNKSGMSNMLNAIGSIYFRKREYAKSFEYQKEALKFAIESGGGIMQARAYNAKSKIHLAQNQPRKALSMAENALKIALDMASKQEIADSYYQLYRAHEKLNNYRKAYEFQSLYIAINDSLKNSKNLRSLEKLKSRHELDKKEAEILLLTQRNQVETFRRNMFIVTLAGLLIIGFLFYNRYRLIAQRKLVLRKQRLDFYTQSLLEKCETINRINRELELSKHNSSEDVHIAKIDKILQSNILTDEDWENFKKAFEDIYPVFFSKLRYKYPAITVSGLRLSALIKLNLSVNEMAFMLGISPESVKTSRSRLKKKLGLAENESVEDFIEKLEFPVNMKN